ncbi:MAG: outer membrane protein transport protein [Myxococcales bacterium]|nr:outer membrane protein transport protein [Myxococcales bacterium]
MLVSLVADRADAGGISSPRNGAGWASPTFATPASIHFNPAAIMSLSGVQLDASLAFIYAEAKYVRNRRSAYQRADGLDFALPVPPAEIDPTRSGWQPEMNGTVMSPGGAASLSWRVSERFALGLSLHPSYAAVLAFPDDGPHRFQMQEVALLASFITPTIAFAPTDWLHLGAGFDLVSGMMSLRQVVDLATTPMLRDSLGQPPISQKNDFGPNAPAGVRELDVLGRPVTINQAEALSWSFKLGATVLVSESLRFALSYQHSTPMVFVGDAYLEMDEDLFTQDLASQGLQYPPLVKGRAWIELPLPASLRFGVAWDVTSQLALHVQASWVRYSAVQDLTVTLQSDDFVQPKLGLGDTTAIALERGWVDTVEAEVLAVWRSGNGMRLGLRGGYHSPMSPDATVDLLSIDGHRMIGSVMLRQAWGGFALSGTVGGQHVFDRTVEASRYDRGNGVYGLTIVHANLGLEWRW